MRVYGEDILDSKAVEKIIRTMSMKFDHVVTTILESHDTDTLSVAELQRSIEIHVNIILEKIEKVKEEPLKIQGNLNNIAKSSQMGEDRARENFNNGGRGNFRGGGRRSFSGRGQGNFNQWRDNNYNNFNPSHQGRGGNNFGSNNRGRGRGYYNQ